jgi:hypothetical protein
MDTRSAAYWRRAAALDPSLLYWETSAADLDRLELRPQRYSRSSLFRAVARQEPVVFSDYPLRSTLRKFFHDDNPSLRLKTLFGSRSKTSTKSGPSQSIKTRRVHEVVDIWQRNRAIVSANDIFYRHPKRDSAFDCEAIGDFSVLRHAPARVRDLEVATLLMGTTGCMTDSHSDDSDGCNHCIAGRKFWLVWDRLEGTEQGLQDCEYETVYEGVNCYFDIRAFSSLRSSRWFTISKGQTLFLPGNLTHKVLTIERYIGISNFYVGLPNALTSLTRWRIHGAKMVTEDLWERHRDVGHETVAQNGRSIPPVQARLGLFPSRGISGPLEPELDGGAEETVVVRRPFQDATRHNEVALRRGQQARSHLTTAGLLETPTIARAIRSQSHGHRGWACDVKATLIHRLLCTPRTAECGKSQFGRRCGWPPSDECRFPIEVG